MARNGPAAHAKTHDVLCSVWITECNVEINLGLAYAVLPLVYIPTWDLSKSLSCIADQIGAALVSRAFTIFFCVNAMDLVSPRFLFVM